MGRCQCEAVGRLREVGGVVVKVVEMDVVVSGRSRCER